MVGGNKCLKILVLVTLIPLALRASSLLLGGHGGVPATGSRHSSWHVTRQPAGLSVSAASVHKAYRQHTKQWKRRAEVKVAAAVDARRLRRVDADAWFEDDKRLAPTGANPLHNL